MCSRESFNNLDNWITELKRYAMPNSKLILIGNKCDDEKNRVVTYEEGKNICKKYNFEFFLEISAKNGFSSPNFLEKAAIILYKDYELHKDDPDTTLNNQDCSIMLEKDFRGKGKSKCC